MTESLAPLVPLEMPAVLEIPEKGGRKVREDSQVTPGPRDRRGIPVALARGGSRAAKGREETVETRENQDRMDHGGHKAQEACLALQEESDQRVPEEQTAHQALLETRDFSESQAPEEPPAQLEILERAAEMGLQDSLDRLVNREYPAEMALRGLRASGEKKETPGDGEPLEMVGNPVFPAAGEKSVPLDLLDAMVMLDLLGPLEP